MSTAEESRGVESMLKRTPLYERHLAADGKMVDFAGWEMPLHYGSQLNEHHQVRNSAGLFDVSHMTIVDIAGSNSLSFLRGLLTNDVIKLDQPGKALYTAMLNDSGGVLDDLIVYRLGDDSYRLVVNCATREKDIAWIQLQAAGKDLVIRERGELAILAVHGPRAMEMTSKVLSPDEAEQVNSLGNFRAIELSGRYIARTGYTGERGLELILTAEDAQWFWDQLVAQGVAPIGLGARDSLRLEAGMNLYGHDMDETISPLEANMEQVITWEPRDRNFIGREAVMSKKQLQVQGKLLQLKGLLLESRGILREGLRVVTDKGEGIITSGGFSPTLGQSIALARIPAGSSTCEVDMRGRMLAARIVKPNFVRFGRSVVE